MEVEDQQEEVSTSKQMDAMLDNMDVGREEIVRAEEVGGESTETWDDDIGSEISDEEVGRGTKSRKRSRNEGSAKKKSCNLLVRQSSGDSMKGSQLVSLEFDQNKIRDAIRYMILVDDLPLKILDNLGFKYLMSVACPMFMMPSRRAMTKHIYEFYCDEKKRLKSLISKHNGRISITIDMWTSIKGINYMRLTAHIIDDDWNLQKRILNFCPISGHKSEEVGKGIEKCLFDWGIDKIFIVTVENVSIYDDAIAYLKRKFDSWGTNILGGKYMHMKCIAHIVNLIVQDGLKNKEEQVVVSRIRGAIRYIRNSPARYKKFNECVWLEKLDTNKLLRLDVPGRWNSTYLMLESALCLRRAFESYEDVDLGYKITLSKPPYDGVPEKYDWERVELLVKFLEYFYKLTLSISEPLTVTSNNVFHELSRVEMLLKEWSDSANFELSVMSTKMKENFEKYWGSIEKMNMIFYFAVILDPRYKLEFIEFSLDAIYDDVSQLAMMKNKVKNGIHELFDTYKKVYGAPECPDVGVSGSSSLGTSQFSSNILLKDQFKKFKSERNEHVKTELKKYLSEDYEDDNEVDVLEWWKLNSHRFPILSKMARDVFAVPVSTVASESTFSTGTKTLDAFRSSLSTKIVQAFICAQNWLRSGSTPISVEEDLGELETLEKELTALGIDNTIIDV